MKLDDVKANIDTFFDNISEEEFFDLLTTKYNMPVVYEIDMSLTKSGADNIVPADLDKIDYRQSYSGYIPSCGTIQDNSSQPLCEITSNDSDCFSFSLSYAS